MAKTGSPISWRQYAALARSYKEFQLELLIGACPEDMHLQGLQQWTRLLANSYKLSRQQLAEATAEATHWQDLLEHCLAQVKRCGATLRDYTAEAEGLTVRERCLSIDIAGQCAEVLSCEAVELQTCGKDMAEQLPESVVTVSVLSEILNM